MNISGSNSTLNRLGESPIARVVAYYVLLFAGTALFVQLVPGAAALVSGGVPQTPAEIESGVRDMVTGGGGQTPIFGAPKGFPLSEVFAMGSAFALMLPVTWIYIMTRRRKGFRQSVVQTLVILPVVVAGVVFLVKNSLALAFSLGGIVAAVSFRNTLRDTKDAVYVFLATAIGLAAAVELPVAAVISIIFNGVILALWFTDFGRSPAPLEGSRAQRRMERAMAEMRKTGSFVAMLDEQIFQEMSPEQLELAADRAWRRKRRQSTEAPTAEELQRRDVLLRIQVDESDAARGSIEEMFDGSLKKWRLGGVVREGDGKQSLEYTVQFKKSAEPDDFLRLVRDMPHVLGAELK